MSATHKIERNIRLYQVYYALYNAFFWMPVFILFFKSKLSIENVLLLESIYYISVFVLEVPSGYLSDRLGRRVTLILSSTAFVLSYLLFSIADGFIQFGIAQFLLAAGISLASGTDTSFHYDSLQSLGKEEEYEKREAIASRNGLISLGLAALIGGGSFYQLENSGDGPMILMGSRSGPEDDIKIIDYVTRKDVRDKYKGRVRIHPEAEDAIAD